jgi:hypothetical protein
MNPGSTESDSGLEARYANFFKVGQNSTEFLLQFGQFHPGSDLLWLTRIIISPVFAKELLRLVRDSVRVHESQYGTIRASGEKEAAK